MTDFREKDVCRLDVSMDHPFRMRTLKRRHDLQSDLDNAVNVAGINLKPLVEVPMLD